jgi:hypothetical protein
MAETRDTLNGIEVASPCTQSWDAMTGDAKRRYCGECRLHVHNLSAMTRVEAEDLLKKADDRVCVRFYRRADGTVLTRDCVPARATIQRRLRRLRVAAAALFGFLGPLGLAACGAGGGATDNGGDPAGTAPGALVDPGADLDPSGGEWVGEPLMGDVKIPEAELPTPVVPTVEDPDTGALTPDEELDDQPVRELLGRMVIR